MTVPFASDSEGVFVDVHSHGGYVGWPWGFANRRTPNDAGLGALSGNSHRSAGTVSGCRRCPINYVSPNTCFAIAHTTYIGMTTVSFACLAFC